MGIIISALCDCFSCVSREFRPRNDQTPLQVPVNGIMAKFLEKMKKAGGEESEAVEAANAAEELREGDLIWLGSGAGGQWRLHRTGADGLAVRVLLDAAHTVVRGLRESRTQEGTHRFYRFRMPPRCPSCSKSSEL